MIPVPAPSTIVGEIVLMVGLDIGTMPRRELSKEELEEALRSNPEARLSDLKALFRCGSETIKRELRRHGLRTKPLSQRDKPWLKGDRNPLHQWHQNTPQFGQDQRGGANPIHKVMHRYCDPVYLAEITRGIRAHAQMKAGRSYEEVYGSAKAETYKAKLRAASPERMRKFHRKETKIEAWARGVLERLGVEFEAQGRVGDFTVDFLVPSAQLVVQVDGDYWHGNPDVYAQLTPRQRQRRGLDAVADRQASDRGLSVLRLWEHDIKMGPDACEKRIEEKIRWKLK